MTSSRKKNQQPGAPILQRAGKPFPDPDQVRVDLCTRELEGVLARHNCIIVPQVVIRGGAIIPQVLIMPKEAAEPGIAGTDLGRNGPPSS